MRPSSIQRPPMMPLDPSLKRNDQSYLEHIRRIRRNLPSQKNSRLSSEESAGRVNYLSNLPTNGINRSKIENYKRIKQEEAEARAKLLAPLSKDLLPSHRRNDSNKNV